jgi:hypothetical protein
MPPWTAGPVSEVTLSPSQGRAEYELQAQADDQPSWRPNHYLYRRTIPPVSYFAILPTTKTIGIHQGARTSTVCAVTS